MGGGKMKCGMGVQFVNFVVFLVIAVVLDWTSPLDVTTLCSIDVSFPIAMLT